MINELLDKIRASDIADQFKKIDHAWTMEPVEKLSEEVPQLLLFPGDVLAAPTQFDNAVRQEPSVQICCFIVSTSDDNDRLRALARSQIIGYVPGEYFSHVEYTKGSVEGIHGRYLWWLDTYTTYTIYTDGD